MGKYRIRVESIDGNETMDEEYVSGIECDGFAVMADTDGIGKGVIAMHDINIMKLAAMMQCSEEFRAAHKLMTLMNLMRFTDVAEKKEPDEKEEFLRRVIGSLDAD